MKILLDESLPRKLKYDFGESHEVFTVHDMGWLSIKNGELLQLMIGEEFEVFVTVDRNLRYQQNLANTPLIIAILIATNNRRTTLQKLIPQLMHLLNVQIVPTIVEIKEK